MYEPARKYDPAWVRHLHDAHPGDRLAIAEMTEPERFLIWAIREWVSDFKLRNGDALTLANSFNQVGATRALGPFYAFLTITAHHGIRNLDVRCHRCGGVGEGEIDILAAVFAAQIGRPGTVRARLASWLGPVAYAAAEFCLDEMMDGLAEGRLRMVTRPEYMETPTDIGFRAAGLAPGQGAPDPT